MTWVNGDDIPHTVVAQNKRFRSKALDTDDRYTFTFQAPGEYAYFCSLHPHMTGKVVVKATDGLTRSEQTREATSAGGWLMMTSGLMLAGTCAGTRIPVQPSAPGSTAALAALRLRDGVLLDGVPRTGPGCCAPPHEPGGAADPDTPVRSARLRRRGGTSFHEVVLPHLDAAYNLARFLTRDADAAEDIVQDAFLRAFRAFAAFAAATRGRGFSRSCATACAAGRASAPESGRSRSRSRLRRRTTDPETEAAEVWDPDQDTPEIALLRDSEASLIRRLIEALPEAFREVLVLREFDDLSYREIAEITATPIGTVMSRLARARQMLGAAWRCQNGEDRA